MKKDNLKNEKQCAIHDVSTRDFEELYEAVKVELQIIKNLTASKEWLIWMRQ